MNVNCTRVNTDTHPSIRHMLCRYRDANFFWCSSLVYGSCMQHQKPNSNDWRLWFIWATWRTKRTFGHGKYVADSALANEREPKNKDESFVCVCVWIVDAWASHRKVFVNLHFMALKICYYMRCDDGGHEPNTKPHMTPQKLLLHSSPSAPYPTRPVNRLSNMTKPILQL